MNDGIEFEADGAPRSLRFGDIYFSPEDGRAESAHVFHAATGFPQSAPDGATIAELGFGVGLNFALARKAWRAARPGASLRYVAFEIAPPPFDAMARSLAPWPDLSECIASLEAGWPPAPGWSTHALGETTLILGIGDAADLLPTWDGEADIWFLDGFAPAKNPAMWEGALLRAVFDRTRAGGRFATYTAAGFVRRGLQAAGFEVERRPGYGRKREMLAGRRPITDD